MRRLYAVILTMPTLGACAGAMDSRVVLNPAAANVQIVTGAPTGCQPLGDVVGSARVEGNPAEANQQARNDIRNKAALLGATHVEIQTNTSGKAAGMWAPSTEVTLAGVAHRCVVQQGH
jgi:hypothetical protein